MCCRGRAGRVTVAHERFVIAGPGRSDAVRDQAGDGKASLRASESRPRSPIAFATAQS